MRVIEAYMLYRLCLPTAQTTGYYKPAHAKMH
jgi:hypothetical protein